MDEVNTKDGVSGLLKQHKKIGLSLVLAAVVVIADPVSATELAPAQIYAEAAPAVVFIVEQSGERQSMGTGSIIGASGLILTNAHVILDQSTNTPAKVIVVFLKPDRISGNYDNPENMTRRFPATVLAYDPALDLALLKIEKLTESLPVLQLADPAGVAIGSRVLAIGHPEQGGLWTLTTGVISAEWKDFTNIPKKDVFQTETSLNWGNSGGPLIDGQGHQVGINSEVRRKSANGLALTSINYAIKSSVAKEWLAKQGVYVPYASSAKGPGAGDSMQGHEPAPQEKEEKDSFPKIPALKPDKILENQPEAKPETGPGLPPLRPYSLDKLLKGLDLVQKDLEKQMDDMGAEIEKRRRR
ncbi:MAG: hypothetical protein NTAFB01_09810 [Nitrospira sp.]